MDGQALFITNLGKIYELNNIPNLLQDSLGVFGIGMSQINQKQHQEEWRNDKSNVVYMLDPIQGPKQIHIPNDEKIIGAVASSTAPLFLTNNGSVYIKKGQHKLILLRTKEKIMWVGKSKFLNKSFLISITGNVYVHNDKLEQFFCETLFFIPSIDYSQKKWQFNFSQLTCPNCKKDFTFFNRRHHCRACGGVVCDNCSKNRILLSEITNLKPAEFSRCKNKDELKKPTRVCDQCVETINAKPEPFKIYPLTPIKNPS